MDTLAGTPRADTYPRALADDAALSAFSEVRKVMACSFDAAVQSVWEQQPFPGGRASGANGNDLQHSIRLFILPDERHVKELL